MLHDFGHLSYSHLFEHVLAKKAKLHNHEIIGIELVSLLRWAVARSEEDPNTLGPRVFATRLLALYLVGERDDKKLREKYPSFFRCYRALKGIVCGTIDMDRCDYVVRDGFFTGMEASFDCGRIVSCFKLFRDLDKKVWFFAPSDRAAQEARSMLTERLERRKLVDCHHKVVFLEIALRKIIENIVEDDFVKTLEGLKGVAKTADSYPRSVYKRLVEQLHGLSRLTNDSESSEKPLTRSGNSMAEVHKAIADALVKCASRYNQIRNCYTRFALYADDSWVDMQVRNRHVNWVESPSESTSDKEIGELLEALVEDTKLYRTLWKSESRFWELFESCYLKREGGSEFNVPMTDRPKPTKMERFMLLSGGRHQGTKPWDDSLIEAFEEKLNKIWEKMRPSKNYKVPGFLLEQPKRRLSTGLPDLSNPTNTAYDIALYSYLANNIMPAHLTSWLVNEREHMPTVYVFAHREFKVTDEEAMDAFIDACEEVQKQVPTVFNSIHSSVAVTNEGTVQSAVADVGPAQS